MKKSIYALCILVFFSMQLSAQHCGLAGTTSIPPHPASGTPGLTPLPQDLPCIDSANYVSDTIYFENYSSISGYTLNLLKIDSINNLPPGLCWVTDQSNNTYVGGQTGVIYISGISHGGYGQYKLVIYVDVLAGPGNTINLRNQNLESLTGGFGSPLRYYLRTKCATNTCLPIDTVGETALNTTFLPDTRACTVSAYAAIFGSSPSICTGDSVILTADPGATSYTYRWSTGATTQSIVTHASGSYTVTVYSSSGDSVISVPYGVVVHPRMASYNIDTLDGTSFCARGGLYLNAGTGFTAYTWSTGMHVANIHVTTAGQYSVIVTDSNGCTYRDTVHVTLTTAGHMHLSIDTTGPLTVCGGISLLPTLGFTSYYWENASTAASAPYAVCSTTGWCIVIAKDNVGCQYKDSIYVTVINLPDPVSICIVSVDSTSGHNMVVWEKTAGANIDSFSVYSQGSVTGSYQWLGSQAWGDFSTFIDPLSNPAQQSSTYVMTTSTLACGASGTYSDAHQTIHLSSNLGVGGSVNLIWNDYVGFTYSSFEIYRGSSPASMSLLATVASTNLSYTDLTPPAPPLYYQVAVINPAGCSPSRSSAYGTSLSNVINLNTTGITSANEEPLRMYYTDDASRTIHFSESITIPTDLKLFDLSGRVVMSENSYIGSSYGISSALSAGVYVLSVHNASISTTRKIQITH